MKLSEERSYLFAVIIVIIGTLIIAAGFTVGLLSLTGSEQRVITEDSVSIDMDMEESEISDFIQDIGIESGDVLPDEAEILGEFDESDLDLRDVISPDEPLDEISPEDKRREILDSADHSVKKDKWIFIDKGNFTLILYDKDEILREWKIAVGLSTGDKQRRGDNRTPNGIFRIRQIQDSSKWTYDFKDGKGIIEGAYGPWFIRLHTPPWTGIGIHGTHDPDSISTRATEGCIRMKNEELDELKNLVRMGMPVVIVE